MAKLEDFQAQATIITEATATISAYVAGTGMTAADQDAALAAVTSAVAGLKAALPEVPAAPAA